MATSPVAAVTGSALGLNDFLKILLTQLTFQDPLKPVDNTAFVAQLAQFSALEQTQQLNQRIDTLTVTQAALQSVGLLGRRVDIATSGGVLSGTVSAVELGTGTPQLTILTTSNSVIKGVGLGQVLQFH